MCTLQKPPPDPNTNPTDPMETTEQTTAQWPVMLTVEQASRCLDISRRTLYKHLQTGQVDAVRIGGQYRIPARALFGEAEARRLERAR